MAMYFSGRRLVKSFTREGSGDRERLEWRVFEEWRDINEGTTARCGNPGTCVVKLTRGLSEKAMSTLKDTIGGSFGVKDVWAFKAEVEETIGRELNWHAATSSEKTFTIQSPRCGCAALTIYQLVRIFEVTIYRKKWFARADNKWAKICTRTFDEPTNNHDGLPDTLPYDPRCGCPEPSVEPKYDGFVCLDFGRISLRVPYTVTETGLEVQIDRQIINVAATDFPSLLRGLDGGLDIEVSSSFIPEPMLFLGEISVLALNGTIRRFTESQEDAGGSMLEVTVAEPKVGLSAGVIAASDVVSAVTGRGDR
jgi:hypothetical protein